MVPVGALFFPHTVFNVRRTKKKHALTCSKQLTTTMDSSFPHNNWLVLIEKKKQIKKYLEYALRGGGGKLPTGKG